MFSSNFKFGHVFQSLFNVFVSDKTCSLGFQNFESNLLFLIHSKSLLVFLTVSECFTLYPNLFDCFCVLSSVFKFSQVCQSLFKLFVSDLTGSLEFQKFESYLLFLTYSKFLLVFLTVSDCFTL